MVIVNLNFIIKYGIGATVWFSQPGHCILVLASRVDFCVNPECLVGFDASVWCAFAIVVVESVCKT